MKRSGPVWNQFLFYRSASFFVLVKIYISNLNIYIYITKSMLFLNNSEIVIVRPHGAANKVVISWARQKFTDCHERKYMCDSPYTFEYFQRITHEHPCNAQNALVYTCLNSPLSIVVYVLLLVTGPLNFYFLYNDCDYSYSLS